MVAMLVPPPPGPGSCAYQDSLFCFAVLKKTVGFMLARALCSTSLGARVWGGMFMYAPRAYWPILARLAVRATVKFCEPCFLATIIGSGGTDGNASQMCVKCLCVGVVAREQGVYSWGRTIEPVEPPVMNHYSKKVSAGCYKSELNGEGTFDMHLSIGGSGKLLKTGIPHSALISGAVVTFRIPQWYGLFYPGAPSWSKFGPVEAMYDHRTLMSRGLLDDQDRPIDKQAHQGCWVPYHPSVKPSLGKLGSAQPAVQPPILPLLCRTTDIEAVVPGEIIVGVGDTIVGDTAEWFDEMDEWVYRIPRRRRVTCPRASLPAEPMLVPATRRNLQLRKEYGIIPITDVEQW